MFLKANQSERRDGERNSIFFKSRRFPKSSKMERVRVLNSRGERPKNSFRMYVSSAHIVLNIYVVSSHEYEQASLSLTVSILFCISGRCGHGSPCEQLCYELHDGMYECDCKDGYILHKNGYSCAGELIPKLTLLVISFFAILARRPPPDFPVDESVYSIPRTFANFATRQLSMKLLPPLPVTSLADLAISGEI